MTPWDRLLDRIDELVHRGTPVTPDVEAELTTLLVDAMRDGVADRELDPDDSGRWLAMLLRTLTALRPDEQRPDDTLSTLRVIVTRWLHPARLDRGAEHLEQAL